MKRNGDYASHPRYNETRRRVPLLEGFLEEEYILQNWMEAVVVVVVVVVVLVVLVIVVQKLKMG